MLPRSQTPLPPVASSSSLASPVPFLRSYTSEHKPSATGALPDIHPAPPLTPLSAALAHLIAVLRPWEARLLHLRTCRNPPESSKESQTSPSLLHATLSPTTSATAPPVLPVSPSPFFASLAEPVPEDADDEIPDAESAQFVEVMTKLVRLGERERPYAIAALLRMAKSATVPEKAQELESAAFFVPGPMFGISDSPASWRGTSRPVASEHEVDERDYAEGQKATDLVAQLVEAIGAGGLDEGAKEDEEEEELDKRVKRRKAWIKAWKRLGIVRAEEKVREAVLDAVLAWDEARREGAKFT